MVFLFALRIEKVGLPFRTLASCHAQGAVARLGVAVGCVLTLRTYSQETKKAS